MPEAIQKGVYLHRKVDTFTDNHHTVCELLTLFPKSIRRMAGIALDIYFDHLLMHRWDDFSKRSSSDLFSRFYGELVTNQQCHGKRFEVVRQGLLSKHWLQHYEQQNTCWKAMHSIEIRLGNRVQFAHEAMLILDANHQAIADNFSEFYPQLLLYAESLAAEN